MEPLNLRLAPPRGPRETLAGIVFTARVVDKLRASLPGGELSGYIALEGFSEMWAHYTGIDLTELREVVADLSTEDEVEAWILERTAHVDKEKVNGRMERYDARRMPDDRRERYNSVYPEELREQYPIIFDLLERDDARLYARR
jgi:hypothetical protein